MSKEFTSEIRYEWSLKTIEEEQKSLYTGFDSKDILSSLFTLWLRDRGDVSDWENAPLFGGIVHTYSNLALPVIAVWLGIEPMRIWEADVPDSAPPWEFIGPTGDVLRLNREISHTE